MVDSLYDHSAVEEKWQSFWATNQLFQHSEKKGEAVNNPLYLLFAFAYPSGSGLHVGHVESKTALDIIARYNRMQGRDVFFPVGWDAFGLPAENYAIKTGTPPAETTSAAITTFRRQIQRLGISYDWGNELATNHPEYYRWTQWLFAQLYSKGLAYQGTGLVNWCPSCQTVLANEQVVEGACERCGTEVTQKQMKQWYFKITQYRDELISGLDSVDWPEPTKQQQLHWIGKSEGVTYAQKVKDLDLEISAYDSVPQTFMAQTFAVIAPESPLLEQLIIGTEHEEPVKKFVTEFQKRKVQNRFKIDTEVEGIFTGRYVENPFGTGDLPIWVATFVIAEYGSGFVNCSAHDERDFAFAKKYGIPLRPVMFPADESEAKRVRGLEYCYHHAPEGVLESPQEFSGRSWGDARSDMIKYIESKGFGTHSSQYRLRDWLISRQRYWGTPIPVIYDPTGEPHLVEDSALPWTLPTDVDFKPTGESPLVSSKEFQERTEQYAASYCADLIKEKGWDATGAGWRPEYDTMDTFVDSSWYYLRYTDSRNTAEFASAEQLQKWLPVDFYMIGPEHIVLHLLYSRFFTKFLRDQGHLQFGEPFLKMRHQGMILGPDGKKMSKSKGNVINPDEIIEKFGADTLRIYEMFMGPIEADKPWDVRAVVGAYKFLQRVHRQVGKNLEALGASSQVATVASPTDQAVQRKLHQTIQKVTDDIPSLKFNTAIAALMEFLNTWEQSTVSAPLSAEDISACIRITAPFAPFLAEELWDNWSKQYSVAVAGIQSVHLSSWPSWDTELAQEEFATLAVQINGKVRAELRVSQAQLADEVAILAQAQALPELQKYLAGAQIKKTIYVPGKILSIVLNT